MSRGVVLVTGINGFLGTYTALAFLEAGYTVRGTARSAAKAGDWINHFPQWEASYQSAVVADFVAPGAFDDAVRGCDVIAHVASPNNPKIEDNERDCLLPAINGTRSLLASTTLEPRIRSVVFTSTLATVLETAKLGSVPGKVYNETDWNGATYEQAKASTDFSFTYGVSKTLAERAFWDFIETEKPAWAGSAILPCAVFDAPIQPLSSLADMNRSVALLWQVASGKFKDGLALAPRHTFYVSARDVALANVRAAEREQARNGRYIVLGGGFTSDELVEILRRRFPALKDNLPPLKMAPDAIVKGSQTQFDVSKTEKDLGIQWMPFEQVVVDTIGAVVELDRKFKLA
ncbi:NAD-P-binding protein [Mycena sanguinolenta]|nr:NAD-P-binding protein [Mycena sanguinolenta]